MITVGTDSEHGLYQNGNLISAIGLIPGTKKDPYPLPHGGGLQVDNVLLEWNSPIAHTADEFNAAIETTLADIHFHIGAKDLGYDSSYMFSMDQLQHPDAWLIGCQPDFDAWKYLDTNSLRESINHKPDFASGLRTAAAHIHVSPFANAKDAAKFITLADAYLGLPSLFLDMDRVRRTLYGTAGSFRFKKYPNGQRGVEYRVLGSFWIADPIYRKWVFDTVEFIKNNLSELRVPSREITTWINEYNLHSADKYINENNILVPA
jgi:hypothetical protein